jgi:hypothetical protein
VPYSSCSGMHRATAAGHWRNSVTTLKALAEQAVDLGRDTTESVEELGRSAGRKLDEARGETGSALHAAASSIRTTGHDGAEAIDNLATGAADRLDATASYVEGHDLRGMFRRFGLRHLAVTLAAAAAIGFVAGSALGRATHSCARTAEGS